MHCSIQTVPPDIFNSRSEFVQGIDEFVDTVLANCRNNLNVRSPVALDRLWPSWSGTYTIYTNTATQQSATISSNPGMSDHFVGSRPILEIRVARLN